jgi:hypothetical protein
VCRPFDSYAASRMDLSSLLPTMRELLVGQLTAPTWSADLSLKEYLGYQDFALPYEDWFTESFPAELQLRHTMAAYELLSRVAPAT